MAVPFSRFTPREAQSAAEAIKDLCTPTAASNPFLADYLSHLASKSAVLSLAMAKEDHRDLTEQAKDEDNQFDDNLRSLRNLAELKAAMPTLGDEAAASAAIAKSIEAHGRTIEEFTRAVQITTMDTLLANWESEEMQGHITTAGVRPIYEEVVVAHGALKKTETMRQELSADGSTVPSMWAASRDVLPVLSRIYSHIENYAAIDEAVYTPLLAELNATLSPIATQVRSRQTRKSGE